MTNDNAWASRCPGCGQAPCPTDERGLCPLQPSGPSVQAMDDVEADEWIGGAA
jgi:hypothetical protein